MNFIYLLPIMALTAFDNAPAAFAKERGDPRPGGAGTASLHACHESLLRHYYVPYHADFSPAYHGSKPVMSTSMDFTSTLVVPTPNNAGYYIYDDDSNITYFPKPKPTLKKPLPGFYKVLIGRKTIYLNENGHDEFDHADQLPRSLGSDTGYKGLSAGKANAKYSAQDSIKAAVLSLLNDECEHYKTDIEQAGSAGGDKAKSRAQLLSALQTCARVADDEIGRAATGQAASCGADVGLSGSDDPSNRSGKYDDDRSTAPKTDDADSAEKSGENKKDSRRPAH